MYPTLNAYVTTLGEVGHKCNPHSNTLSLSSNHSLSQSAESDRSPPQITRMISTTQITRMVAKNHSLDTNATTHFHPNALHSVCHKYRAISRKTVHRTYCAPAKHKRCACVFRAAPSVSHTQCSKHNKILLETYYFPCFPILRLGVGPKHRSLLTPLSAHPNVLHSERHKSRAITRMVAMTHSLDTNTTTFPKVATYLSMMCPSNPSQSPRCAQVHGLH